MILPCVLYRVPDEVFEPMMARFQPLCNQAHIYLQIMMRTDSAEDVVNVLNKTSCVLLLITCIENLQSKEGQLALKLGHVAMRHNRDSYVIYSASDSKTMLQATPHCLRAAGIVTNAILAERSDRLLQTILDDYASIHQEEDNSPWIQLKVQGAMRRVQMGSIIAITAANKKINITLENETLSVYGTLESFLEKADERFIRCHRTCVVNREKISRVDFTQMSIYMFNGLEVPLSRTLKKAFRNLESDQNESELPEGG